MLGSRIDEYQKIKKLSNQALADVLSVSTSALFQWKSGARKPSNSNLQKLSQALNVSIDYLMGQTDDPGSTLLQPLIQAPGRAHRAEYENLSFRATRLREEVRAAYKNLSPQDRLMIKTTLQAALADISDMELK